MKTLPYMLKKRRAKLLVLTAAIAAVSVGAAVTVDWRAYFFLIFSAIFLYMALMVQRDFSRGKLVERRMICIGLKASPASNHSVASFRTAGEQAEVMHFYVAGRVKKNQFLAGRAYNCYYHIDNPTVLMEYEPIFE